MNVYLLMRCSACTLVLLQYDQPRRMRRSADRSRLPCLFATTITITPQPKFIFDSLLFSQNERVTVGSSSWIGGDNKLLVARIGFIHEGAAGARSLWQ